MTAHNYLSPHRVRRAPYQKSVIYVSASIMALMILDLASRCRPLAAAMNVQSTPRAAPDVVCDQIVSAATARGRLN